MSTSTAKLPAMDTMRLRLPVAEASGEDVCAAVCMNEGVGDHAELNVMGLKRHIHGRNEISISGLRI